MGAIDVDTDLGPIRFLGRDAGAPVVLVITGAFAMENQVDRLQDRFPSLDVLRAHLPGNHSPPMDIPSVGVFGAAFTAALDARFPGRPLVLVGLSVGALVAMATRARGTRAMLLVEPPLVITEAWPLEALPREAPPGNEEFLWNVFGLGRAVIEPRDYRPLVSQIGVPAHVLLGDPPPPRGPWGNTMPGLVGPLSRAALKANPRITIQDLPGVGHHVVRHAGFELLAAIHRTAELAFGAEAAALNLPPGVTLPAYTPPGPRRGSA